jgi:hypothetical protein
MKKYYIFIFSFFFGYSILSCDSIEKTYTIDNQRDFDAHFSTLINPENIFELIDLIIWNNNVGGFNLPLDEK